MNLLPPITHLEITIAFLRDDIPHQMTVTPGNEKLFDSDQALTVDRTQTLHQA